MADFGLTEAASRGRAQWDECIAGSRVRVGEISAELGAGGRELERFDGIRPTVVVTIPVQALLPHPDGLPAPSEPAMLDGVVPIDPRTARRLAEGCDIDHTIDWQHGGPTRADNLAHLCRGHHTLKHQTRWQMNQDRDGTMTWRAPSGAVHATVPPGAFARSR